jgi:hypothetical protein
MTVVPAEPQVVVLPAIARLESDLELGLAVFTQQLGRLMVEEDRGAYRPVSWPLTHSVSRRVQEWAA